MLNGNSYLLVATAKLGHEMGNEEGDNRKVNDPFLDRPSAVHRLQFVSRLTYVT